MERRYAKELRARGTDEEWREPDADPDALTEQLDSVDVRAFAARDHTEARLEPPAPKAAAPRPSRTGPPARRPPGTP